MKSTGTIIFMALVLMSAQGHFELVPASQETQLAYDAILVLDNSGSMKPLKKEVLRSFVGGLGDENRLGVILFGTNAKLIHPLKANVTAEEKRLVQEALDQWDFSDQFTNFNPAFEIALQQMKSTGRDNARKVVILLSDGKVDYGQVAGTKEELLLILRNNLLPACRNEEIFVIALAWGKRADYSLMSEIAEKTNGLCLNAPTSEELKGALNRIKELWQPKVDPSPSVTPALHPARVEEEAVPPPVAHEEIPKATPLLPFASVLTLWIVVAILILLAVITLLATIRNREYLMVAHSAQVAPTESKLAPSGSESPPSMVKLLKLISDAKSYLDTIQDGLKSYGADSYGEERASRENYSRVLGRLFYLLDQIDVLQNTKEDFQGADWIRERLEILLNDEEIQVIPVVIGEPMNSLYHKCVAERSDAQLGGMVISVVRNGYMLKRDGKELILRPAEVVVSKGSEK